LNTLSIVIARESGQSSNHRRQMDASPSRADTAYWMPRWGLRSDGAKR
jgi:hypothetical protein